MSDVTVINTSEGGLMPPSLTEKMQMAGALAKSRLMPKGLDTPEQVFVALQMGHELGLNPMVAVNNIAVVNQKPCLSANIMKAIVFSKKVIADYNEEIIKKNNLFYGYKVTAKRKDMSTVFEATFTMDDAKTADLLGKDNWKKYPDQMCLHRATAFCLRKAFPEIISGLYTPEEMQDSAPQRHEVKQQPKPRDVTPPKHEENNKQEPVIEPVVEPEVEYPDIRELYLDFTVMVDKIGLNLDERDSFKIADMSTAYTNKDPVVTPKLLSEVNVYLKKKYAKFLDDSQI